MITNPGHRGVVERAVPAFQQEYGIEVEVTYMNGREASERLLAEYGAGQVRTDAVVSGDSNFWSVAQTGALDSYTVPNAAAISERLQASIGPDNTYYPQMLNVYGLVVNTEVIPPERIPRRWADLADPYYRGKMVVHNPTTTGGGNSWLSTAHETPGLGRPFLEKIAQQDVIIVQDPAGVEAMVARGERGIGVPAGGRSVLTQPGAPMKWIVPEEGVAFSIQTVGVPKQAPHPNAGRVWANFTLSKQVQEWWYEYGHYTPVRTDVVLDPPEYNLANLPLLAGTGNRPAAEAQRWLNIGKSIFGP
jgi:iron(III) transport system substrate-binding protein